MKIHRRLTIYGNPSLIRINSRGGLILRQGDKFEILEYTDTIGVKDDGKPLKQRIVLVTVPKNQERLTVRHFNPKTGEVQVTHLLPDDDQVIPDDSWRKECV